MPVTDQLPNDAQRLSTTLDQLRRTAENLSAVVEKTIAVLGKDAAAVGPEVRRRVASFHSQVVITKDGLHEVNRQFELVQRLVDTSALLTSSLDLEVVLKEIIDIIVALTGAERAYLMLRDEATGELKSRAARNWDREAISPEDVQVSLGVIDSAIEQGRPIVTTNALVDERFKDRNSVASQNLLSIVCVPLILREKTIGVLYADNRMRQGLFSHDIADILTAFANQTAIAIENARLFGQVKQDLDEAVQAVQRLRINIDEHKTHRHVSDIIDSEFFQKLRDSALADEDDDPSTPPASSDAPVA
jgi:transcriptional regulator with GAF, ATPase, and Fis domain